MNARAAQLGWQHRGFRTQNRRTALVALATLIGLLALPDLVTAARFGQEPMLCDLRIYRDIAWGYLRDSSPGLYNRHHNFLYPPFFLVFIVPLFQLPLGVAAVVFQIVKWISVFVALVCAWRLAAPDDEDQPPLVALGSLLLTFRYFSNDMGNGNINTTILALVLASAWLIRRRAPFSAGVVLGFATCIKITPVLMLLYFVAKGWWRALLGAAAAGGLCLLLIPGLYLAWRHNLVELAGWYEHLVRGYLLRGEVYSIHINQSLPSVINRLFGPYLAIEPDTYLPLTVLRPEALAAVQAAVKVIVLVTLAWSLRGRVDPRTQPLRFAGDVALVQIATLLLSGYSWKAHFVALLLPYTVILAYLADARRRPHAVLVQSGLALSFLLYVGSSTLIGRSGSDYAEAYGAITLLALCVAAAVIAVRAATAPAVGQADAASVHTAEAYPRSG